MNFQEEHLLSWRNRLGVTMRGKMQALTERPRPDPCNNSQYRVDYDLFRQLFPRLLPWPCSDIFIIRLFRLFDVSDCGLLTFRDISLSLSILLKGDALDKLTLFYKCHLPPAFTLSDLDEIMSPDTEMQGKGDEPEVALEAAEMCEPDLITKGTAAAAGTSSSDADNSTEMRPRSSTTNSLVVIDKTSEAASSLIDIIATRSAHGSEPSEEQSGVELADEASQEYSLVDESIEKLKNLRTSIAENAPVSQRMEMRSLPVLNQTQFIQLWKTFYNLLNEKDTDQQLFHSLAVSGTLLLQLGEAHRELQAKLESQIADAIKENDEETLKKEADGQSEFSSEDEAEDVLTAQCRRIGQISNSMSDNEWRINLEQIVATVMSDEPLAAFFEKKYSLSAIIARFQKTRFRSKSQSSS
ncbi:hypothetical protein WR25_05917 [Diploscapter pachys]|uniref:EF-hand domain-containing protein n=1 Tax=Diploscapter pachys TaxID=2018661 RepID=A0A2A2KVJ8_9BILA|nr:hypothetical protein WR25_05917 [Diploscapter pachys]